MPYVSWPPWKVSRTPQSRDKCEGGPSVATVSGAGDPGQGVHRWAGFRFSSPEERPLGDRAGTLHPELGRLGCTEGTLLWAPVGAALMTLLEQGGPWSLGTSGLGGHLGWLWGWLLCSSGNAGTGKRGRGSLTPELSRDVPVTILEKVSLSRWVATFYPV